MMRLAVACGKDSAVNIRAEPNTHCAILGTLPQKGAIVRLERNEGAWWIITSGSVSGFICMEYVDFEWFAPVHLDVPFVTQQGNAIHNDCGAASVRMLALYYHGQAPSIEDIAAATGTTNQLTTAQDLLRMGTYCGLSLQISYELSLVKHYRLLTSSTPAIPLVDYGDFDPQPYVYDGGHWLVATGMQLTSMLLNDPLQYSSDWYVPINQFAMSLDSYLVF